jgi:hypothetical protein
MRLVLVAIGAIALVLWSIWAALSPEPLEEPATAASGFPTEVPLPPSRPVVESEKKKAAKPPSR